MNKLMGWIARAVSPALAVSASLSLSAAEAQVLRVLSASCEIYNFAALQCFPPVEIHRVSPASFTSFADSALVSFYGCSPQSRVGNDVQQITTILSDSIFIHERVYADVGGAQGLPALTKSDATIVFRVDAGKRYSYHMRGGVWSENPGSGTAVSSVTLTRLTPPGGGVVHSFRVQSGPGPPTEQGLPIDPRGILEAGDYALEAHTRADDPPNSGDWSSGEVFLRLKLRDVTTAVEHSTWTVVKSLYR